MSNLNLEQLRKRAKELVAAVAAGDIEAIAFVRTHHPTWSGGAFQLSDAQWAIARSHGEASWPALVHRLEARWLPLVAVRNLVVFPEQQTVLDVGRARSMRAVDAALAGDARIALFAQRAASIEEPGCADLYPIGTIAEIVSVDDRLRAAKKVTVRGRERVRLVRVDERDGMLVAGVAAPPAGKPVDAEEVRRTAILLLDTIDRELRKMPPDADPFTPVLPHLHLLPAEIQQQVLETADPAGLVRALGAALRSS
jgi:ATP-dependent protease La (Lon)-like substrate-binding protein